MKQVNECKDRNCGDFKERRKQKMTILEKIKQNALKIGNKPAYSVENGGGAEHNLAGVR